MSQFAKELKMYADSGMRTAADWLTVGREVENGSKPRSNLDWRGTVIEFFTRDQTQRRQSRRQLEERSSKL
jgi:hypothetical protein